MPGPQKLSVNFGHGSSAGRVRETNQDYHRVKVLNTPRGPLYFLAVADGMGGAAAGERASKIAIETLTDAINRYVDFLNEGRPAVSLEKALEKAFLAANREIYREAAANPSRDGMGTTLTVLLLSGRELVLGHVGDSRCYRIRGGRISQLSKDHSWVAEQVEKGALTPEEAATHQYRNLLVKALGTRNRVEPQIVTDELQNGDMFVLCSDGLHGLVSEGELLEELGRNATLQSAIDFFIGLAESRGGPDNITAVVAQVQS
ncbi:MAG TPA: protein phosphatase 2C domain-containing protein [Deinococcales bacterium]|nr:protein phosphatase 2C domain-containing protein [Deinococcales bacterium]